MATPMNEPSTAIASEAVVTGESIVPVAPTGAVPATHMWVAKNTVAGGGAVGAVAFGQDTAGDTCSYVSHGLASCMAAAAVPIGSPITPSASSRWQVATTGHIVHGYALTAAAADGDLFQAFLGTADAGRAMP